MTDRDLAPGTLFLYRGMLSDELPLMRGDASLGDRCIIWCDADPTELCDKPVLVLWAPQQPLVGGGPGSRRV